MVFIWPSVHLCRGVCSSIQGFVLVSMVYVLCYPINVSYLLHYCLYLSLSNFKARGGARNAKLLGFYVVDDIILYTCLSLKHVKFRIQLTTWARGGYQSHSEILACVERSSSHAWGCLIFSRLRNVWGFTLLVFLPPSLETEGRNHGMWRIKRAVDVKIKCQRALREACYKSLQQGDIDCDWDGCWVI